MNNHTSKSIVLKAPSGSIRGNQQWLEDLQAPDKRRDEALDELSNYLVRNLTRYLFVCRGDLSRYGEQELKQLARDFSQETLLKILHKLHTFQGRSSFLTWANRISIYLASGKLRRLHWKEVSLNRSIWDGEDEQFLDLVEARDDYDPERSLEKSEICETLRRIIEQELTPPQRLVVINILFYGQSTDMIAKRLNTNHNNIYKIMHDARKQIRRRLLISSISPSYALAVFGDGGTSRRTPYINAVQ